MYQNEFNPITFILQLKLADPINVKKWTDITSYIIEKYAQELSINDDIYIGHIKAIFTGDEKDYIKLSIYRKDIPVNFEYSGDGTYNEIMLIINSIVHNVDEETSLRTLDQICDKCKKQFLIAYNVKQISHKEHSAQTACP